MLTRDIVSKQIPEFVREEYPAFVEFIKAYYEYLSTVEVDTLEHLVDIDNTIDDFVKYFKAQLDVNGVDYPFISPRLFLRHSKDLFSSKGSQQSIEFLFRILYGKGSEVITPWDYVLIPSVAKWHQDISIFVTIAKGSASNLEGDYILISGTDGKQHAAFVKSVVPYSSDVYQLFLDKFDYSYIHYTSTFMSKNLLTIGNLVRTTSKVKVVDGGSGFVVGQLFNISGFAGTGTIVKVKSVDINGKITSAEIIEFGTGYNTSFTVSVYPENAIFTRQSSINLVNTGDNPVDATYNTNDALNNPTEGFTMVMHNYTTGTFFQDMTYAGKTVAEGQSQDNAAKVKTVTNAATLMLTIGAMANYPGYYLDGSSIISDQSYIQDSYYYQKFSYVTAIEEVLDNYKTVLKNTLHPIGTEHFGRYVISNDLLISLVVDPQLNSIAQATPIQDSVTATDNIAFGVHKYLQDTVSATMQGYAVGRPYTEVIPDPYWDITYLENEQPLTNEGI